MVQSVMGGEPMGLIRCPQCNGIVSTLAEKCVHCGRSLEMTDEARREAKRRLCDVVLLKSGEDAVKTAEVVCEITGLGLGDARALVENAPSLIAREVPRSQGR